MPQNYNIHRIRDAVGEIRWNLAKKPRSLYWCFRDSKSSFKKMNSIFDSNISYEDNAVQIHSYFNNVAMNWYYKTLELCEKELIRGKRYSPRTKWEIRRVFMKSCDQSIFKMCGDKTQLMVSFLLQKGNIKNKVNDGRIDISAISNTGKKIPINVKHTVKDKINDNSHPVKIVWGAINQGSKQKNGGFSAEGFEKWVANNESILIIVDPQGRDGANKYAQQKNIDANILSIDEGLVQIKRLLTPLSEAAEYNR